MEDDGPSDSTGRLRLLRRGQRRPRKPHPPREALPATGALARYAIEAAALAAVAELPSSDPDTDPGAEDDLPRQPPVVIWALQTNPPRYGEEGVGRGWAASR
jgi:hypothetical protein